jgi:hypothetical protein
MPPNLRRYEISLAGTATAEPAPPGSTTTATPPAAARLSVTVALETASPDGSTTSSPGEQSAAALIPTTATSRRLYESPDAAVADSGALAAEAARKVASRLTAHPAAAPARPPSAPGAVNAPLRFPELQIWAWLLALKAEAAGRLAAGQVAPLAASSALSQPFAVYSRIGVLPGDDPSSVERMLTLAAAQARAGQAAGAVQLLDDLIERLQEDFEAAGPDGSSSSSSGSGSGGAARGGGGPPLSPYLVPACVYAQLLDQCEDPFADLGSRAAGDDAGDGSSSSSTSGSNSTDLRRLVTFQLQQRAAKAPKDALAAPAAAVTRLLGPRHPVAKVLSDAAEANMSMAARQARELRQQQAALASSMEVLKVG